MQATLLWFHRQDLLQPCANAFTAPGFRRKVFRTKGELLVELLRSEANHVSGRHLGVFDGAFALRSVVRPLTQPEAGQPRVEFLTRLRGDGRRHARPAAHRPRPRRGPKPKGGAKLPPPRQGGRWPGAWQHGQAWLYGRGRKVRYQEVVCLGRVAGLRWWSRRWWPRWRATASVSP